MVRKSHGSHAVPRDVAAVEQHATAEPSTHGGARVGHLAIDLVELREVDVGAVSLLLLVLKEDGPKEHEEGHKFLGGG